MNDDRNFDRDVASVFAETAPSRSPDDLLENVFLTTGSMRPRPRWLARIKEPPMRYSDSVAVGSPTARVVAVMVATLLITLMLAGAGIAGSRLLAADGAIVVDQSGNGDFTTISAAVEAAVAGDTILVRPGTYEESVAIDKDIEILGDASDSSTVIVRIAADGPRVDGGGERGDARYAFALRDSDAVVGNLSIERPETIGVHVGIRVDGGEPTLHDIAAFAEGPLYFPFVVLSGAGGVVRDSTSDGSIEAGEGATTLLEGNRLIGDPSRHSGLDPERPGAGIETGDGEVGAINIGIKGNTLNYVWVNPFASAAIEGNEIVGLTAPTDLSGSPPAGSHSCGLYMTFLTETTVRDNLIHDHSIGACANGGTSTLTGNRILNNVVGVLASDFGPPDADPVDAEGNADVDANEVSGNGVGLVFDATSRGSITNNELCGNGSDLDIADGAAVVSEANEVCESPN